ncbi:HK97 gp10 family phage protein [[Ruminococcus] lactaris]|uniref:HK97 gp10 family phage protein n=1 Tax=[Ruminococcus] lactaris TaxID=46228 RepID=UPI001F2BA938|nr:HK97 gp10 family phage protein [[Ruminococcus] lactaris]
MSSTINFKQKGDFSKLNRYFERLRETAKIGVLDKYGRAGVEALSSATPKETGKTASSWYYEIKRQNGSVSLEFYKPYVIKYKTDKDRLYVPWLVYIKYSYKCYIFCGRNLHCQ